MSRDEVVTLITVTGEKRDDRGFNTGEETVEADVFASVLSVTGAEFYNALRSGMKATIKISLDPDDYRSGNQLVDGKVKRPSRIRWNKVEYRIIRDYKPSSDEIQITCEEAS